MFNDLKIELLHLRDDVFIGAHYLHGFDGRRINFICSDQGKIERLEALLEQRLGHIVFTRIDD